MVDTQKSLTPNSNHVELDYLGRIFNLNVEIKYSKTICDWEMIFECGTTIVIDNRDINSAFLKYMKDYINVMFEFCIREKDLHDKYNHNKSYFSLPSFSLVTHSIVDIFKIYSAMINYISKPDTVEKLKLTHKSYKFGL
jgi:hypothetical protein